MADFGDEPIDAQITRYHYIITRVLYYVNVLEYGNFTPFYTIIPTYFVIADTADAFQ